MGYYFLQPFKKKSLTNDLTTYSFDNDYNDSSLSGYKATLHHLIFSSIQLKPFNYVLPELDNSNRLTIDNDNKSNKKNKLSHDKKQVSVFFFMIRFDSYYYHRLFKVNDIVIFSQLVRI